MRVFEPIGRTVAALSLVLASLIGLGQTAAAQEVNIYSYRQPFLINPVLEAFTAETGIKVNVVYAKTGLLERLKAEGRNSPADTILTADIGRLQDLVAADLLAPVESAVLRARIPANLREPKGRWFALSLRARVIFASKDRVAEGAIATYEDLADPKWRGRLCMRPARHVYNVALIASMIAEHGDTAAEQWLTGLKANLARKPQGNDRAQVRAIKEGQCDIALGMHYYMGKMLGDPKQKAWAEAVRIVFPNQADRGTHINISGAAVTRSAKNREAAVALIEFLVGDTAQQIYAAQNFEYPVVNGIALHPLVASWGRFKADGIAIERIGRLRAAAIRMIDRVGFDQ